MTILKRTTSADTGFHSLVILLDKDLKIRDGEDHPFFALYNTLDNIKHVVVCYDKDKPVACGAFKEFGDRSVEIKRMFVLPEYRRNGIASSVLQELEKWATELNYLSCVLETGKKQPEAIALYAKTGYTVIANYHQYENVESSVCMKKTLEQENKM